MSVFSFGKKENIIIELDGLTWTVYPACDKRSLPIKTSQGVGCDYRVQREGVHLWPHGSQR